jgi:predicted tellurium resistance membrane protein TerC
MNPNKETRSRNVRSVVFWIGLGLALGLWVLATQGPTMAAEYYSAYFLEKSLSVDNIFVFAIIFSELHVPPEYQRRVLQFGIAGALVFRAILIGAGIALIERFSSVTYPFAALMLFAAWRMLFAAEREREVVAAACDVCDTWIARVVRVSPVLHGHDSGGATAVSSWPRRCSSRSSSSRRATLSSRSTPCRRCWRSPEIR